jgi:hypothetical protein
VTKIQKTAEKNNSFMMRKSLCEALMENVVMATAAAMRQGFQARKKNMRERERERAEKERERDKEGKGEKEHRLK